MATFEEKKAIKRHKNALHLKLTGFDTIRENQRKQLIYKRIKQCRWRESNPHSSCPERDFESRASASSATPAQPAKYKGIKALFQAGARGAG